MSKDNRNCKSGREFIPATLEKLGLRILENLPEEKAIEWRSQFLCSTLRPEAGPEFAAWLMDDMLQFVNEERLGAATAKRVRDAIKTVEKLLREGGDPAQWRCAYNIASPLGPEVNSRWRPAAAALNAAADVAWMYTEGKTAAFAFAARDGARAHGASAEAAAQCQGEAAARIADAMAFGQAWIRMGDKLLELLNSLSR